MNLKVSAKELRDKLSEVLNTVSFGKKHVLVTRHNKPQAVIMDYDAFEWLTNPRLRFTDKQWREGFDVIDEIRSKAKPMTQREFAEFEKIVDDTIHEIRHKRSAQSRR